MSNVYKAIIKVADKFVPLGLRPLWEHPAGPKTIFFWAPAMKWGLVIAGLGDINRPAANLSISQSASLAATGCIWSRYSLVIIPKNYSLFTVNVFVALTNLYQLARAYRYQVSLEEEKKKTKKALVMASLDDYRRPLDKVSTKQSATLSAAGFIWTRYCLTITPVNYSLSICNFMMGVANGVQFARAYMHQNKIKSIA